MQSQEMRFLDLKPVPSPSCNGWFLLKRDPDADQSNWSYWIEFCVFCKRWGTTLQEWSVRAWSDENGFKSSTRKCWECSSGDRYNYRNGNIPAVPVKVSVPANYIGASFGESFGGMSDAWQRYLLDFPKSAKFVTLQGKDETHLNRAFHALRMAIGKGGASYASQCWTLDEIARAWHKRREDKDAPDVVTEALKTNILCLYGITRCKTTPGLIDVFMSILYNRVDNHKPTILAIHYSKDRGSDPKHPEMSVFGDDIETMLENFTHVQV